MSTEGDDFSGSSGLLVKKVFIEPEYSAVSLDLLPMPFR
jgi:hypothetical protein